MQSNKHGVDSFPMPTNTTFGPYLRVKLVSGAALANAVDKELGTLANRVYSTRGVLGSSTVATVVLSNAQGTVRMIASGAITQYADVFADDAGLVTATPNGNYEGVALTATANSGDELVVLRKTGAPRKLYTLLVPPAAVTNTAVETAFASTVPVKANSLRANARVRIRAKVTATATNAADTLTVKVKFAGTTLVTTAAVDVLNADTALVDLLLHIRTDGAGGTFIADGWETLGTPGTATAKSVDVASTAIDTTADQTVSVTATWSAANAGDSCRLDVLDVDVE